MTFQSTHPGGVRPKAGLSIQSSLRDFNPRTRVGCDQMLRLLGAVEAGISIHAPGWGATILERHPHRFLVNFNPRTRVGCDRRNWRRCGMFFDFNPRTRVGCDNAYISLALF